MHMLLVHGRPEIRNKCNSCDRDTNVINDPDIIEDDMKARFGEDKEDDFEVPDKPDDSKATEKSNIEDEALCRSDIAEVTSVRDDRGQDYKHFEKSQEAFEAENNVVHQIFKPVGALLQSCSNCGESDHTSGRKVRRKHCLAWNKYCEICGKRGHIGRVCKGDQSSSADSYPSLGEIAALRYCLASISKQLQPTKKVNLPHMVYDQLGWSVSRTKPAPYVKVSVKVDTQSYRDQNIRPPSAYRHREADILALADTGCAAVCMGPEQLPKLGLSRSDLMAAQMELRAANETGIKILGALFVNIVGESTLGKVYQTKEICYVAEGVGKMLLSREAYEKLGMINKKFPAVGSADSDESRSVPVSNVTQNPAAALNDEHFDLEPCSPNDDGTCSCPRRESCPPPPKFDPTLSTSGLRKLLIKHYGASAFNRCTRQTLPLMQGEPLPIPTRSDVKPTAVHTPVAIPLHWEDKVHRDLMRDVALGVIEPVPINTPVTWCSRMVVVPKHSGEPRRTVDLQALNRASVRQTHHTRSPFMLASAIPAGTVKSVLDVWNSFHSVPLRMEDRDKTTFITPWGRFRYKVAPQGYLASMDGYTHRFSLITQNIKNKQVIVDDTALWSDTVEENFYLVSELLETGHKAGLIFNSDKFQFGQDTIETLSEARSFFGMINQVSYSFSMSAIMEPLRHLLKPDTWTQGFSWTPELDRTFNLAKEEILNSVTDGVKHFDVERWTCLATDWSRQGIGFFLMQKWCDCSTLHPKCCNDGWKLVLAGGRFTKPAESRYSPVEGEMLGVVEGLHKAKHFILGCEKLIVAVDHKPLLGLLNDKSLADIDNPRLLMLKEKTLWFNFQVIWVPGRTNSGPDFMSRVKNETTKQARINCILGFSRTNKGEARCGDIQISEVDIIDSIVSSIDSIEAITFDKVKEEVQKDQELMKLVDAISNLSELDNFPDYLSKYSKLRDSLSVVDGVPMYGRRLIIPSTLRQRVLECLHSAHQCPMKMNDRAKHSVYWPGITSDIENVRRACVYCNRNAPTQPMMPPLPLASPDFPYQMIVADYFTVKSKTWLVVADRFSGWLSLFYYPREASASDLIKHLKEYFTTFGIAEHFSSDAGPQFLSSTFQSFLKTWGIQHRTSSAYFPKSNLRAESAVKSAKRIVLDNTKSDGSPEMDKIARAIMQHRNTPDSEYGLSPAQIVFGRPLRDFLPVRPGDFSPSEVWIDDREKRELANRKRFLRGSERWSAHTRDLPPLSPGSRVMIQNQHGAGKSAKRWDKSGMVLEHLGFNKYRVKVDGSGRVTERNRQFLRKFTPVTPSMPGPNPSTGNHQTNPSPSSSEIPQHFEPTPVSQYTPETVSSPTLPESMSADFPLFPAPVSSPSTPRLADTPSPPASPSSPSFMTPPSSPAMTPNTSEPVGVQPETPTLPRQSTRARRPPDRFGYDKF